MMKIKNIFENFNNKPLEKLSSKDLCLINNYLLITELNHFFNLSIILFVNLFEI